MQRLALAGAANLSLLFAACRVPPETTDSTIPVSVEGEPEASVSETAPTGAADATDRPEGGPALCPDDMVHVDTTFCTQIDRPCLDLEHDRYNNLDICHAFGKSAHCSGTQRRIAFCIDRYEYPNRSGAHPAWMLDWYEAQATCESHGKRLCWSSEWTAACEGNGHTPFPYGFERDHEVCNMDNWFIEPMRPGPTAQFFFYFDDRDVANRELSRLDQSVPSGSMENCKSDLGVHDLTGNLDEWVVSDEPPREKSKWAGLKGGAWGHVRSQCRPMTYSHEPDFRYYFVGFRCCRDADARATEDAAAPWTRSPGAMVAPDVPPHDYAPDPIVSQDPPGPSKTKFSWVRKAD